jgi:hypothetical protein
MTALKKGRVSTIPEAEAGLPLALSERHLIVAVYLLKLGHCPYNATQAGVVSTFTVVCFGVLMAVCSFPGEVSAESIRRQMEPIDNRLARRLRVD